MAVLANYMAAAEMSQDELSKKARLHRTTLYNIEQGMHKPRPKTIGRIARALGPRLGLEPKAFAIQLANELEAEWDKAVRE